MGSKRSSPLNGVLSSVFQANPVKYLFDGYLSVWNTVSSRHPVGTNVFEREWDLLILLDTCRVDALAEVKSEYDFLNDIDSIISVGSTSSEWIANTFRSEYKEQISSTAYISANAHSKRVLEEQTYPDPQFQKFGNVAHNMVSEESLLLHDQPWEYIDDDLPGHINPDALTDRAIQVGRRLDPESLIVHYSQPHAPYAAGAISESRDLYDFEEEPFVSLQNGGDFKKVWSAYINELRFVLDSIETLLQNTDADTVAISADHGESFGEFGLYGHFQGMLHPYVKRVPWAITSARDRGSYVPSVEPEDDTVQTVDEQLQALGYK